MYDILIIGGGPGGICAAIYAKRANKKVAIIERAVPGGQVAEIGKIENYPGFTCISGSDLSLNFYNQAKSLGIEFIFDEAVSFKLRGKVKRVECSQGTYEAKTIIIAIGSNPRELNVPGERKFFGKGVSYCAICDANFFKGQKVAVVGSGDSAFSNAVYLSNICSSVDIFAKNNLEKLKAYSEDMMKKYKNITVHKNVKVLDVVGKDKVEGLKYEENGQEKTTKFNGIFVAIGRTPDTAKFEGQLKLNEKGYIITKNEVFTNIKGVFACGDVCESALKQIVVAASGGATAALRAIEYLSKN